MIFLSKVEHLIVWNPTLRKVLGQFEDGVYNATTKEEIAILDAVPEAYRADKSTPEGEGYVAPKEPAIEIPDIELQDMSALQLKAYAKREGISLKGKAGSKNKMIAAIEKAEAEVSQD